jgi:hypothetical protein
MILFYLAYPKKYLEETEAAAFDEESGSGIPRADSKSLTADFDPVASPLRKHKSPSLLERRQGRLTGITGT